MSMNHLRRNAASGNNRSRCHWSRREFLSSVGSGALGASLLGGLGTLAPSLVRATEGTRFAGQETAISDKGVIASISRYATDVGIQVLNAGGNAIDAAVATVFALGVTRPEMCGIGGCGMLVYRSAGGQTAALDFQGSTGAGFPSDAFAGPGMHIDQNHNPLFPVVEYSGHRVVGIPGVVAGMAAAHARFGSGRFRFGDLIAPAEHLARFGFEMTDELALSIFLEKQRLSYYQDTAETYLPYDVLGYRWESQTGLDGGLPVERYTLIQEEYADSLCRIMDGGRDAFYRGPIADLIADDMANAKTNAESNAVLLAFGETNWGGASNDEGFITYDDLASYQAIWREPTLITYRSHEIITMPPCGSGVLIAEMLNILEGFDLKGYGHSSANYLHLLAEAQKIAYADRQRYIADPDLHGDGTFNAEILTSKAYAKSRRSEIDMNHAKLYGESMARSPSHTNHMSAIDREGNAVSITTSQGWPFGSVVMAPGTGFVLNDQLGDWIGRLGIDQPFPGARPRTNMSPTIVVRKGRPVLVTGAAGGDMIPMGIVQQILNVVDFGMSIPRAIDAERMDAVNFGLSDAGRQAGAVNALAIESGGARPLPAEVKQSLIDRGHDVQERPEYDVLPIVQTAGIQLATGLRFAVSDPRAEGGAKGQ